jgi:hypothetical protein
MLSLRLRPQYENLLRLLVVLTIMCWPLVSVKGILASTVVLVKEVERHWTTSVSLPITYTPGGVGVPGAPAPFSAVINGNNVNLSWTNDPAATGVIILRGEAPPTSITDGTIIYNGSGTSYTDPGVASETTQYYYSAWSYSGVGYSTSYAAATIGGAGMILIGIGVLFMLAIILYIAGQLKDKDSLNYVSAVFWFVGGAFAFSQRASNAIYVYAGFAGFIIGVIVAISTGVESFGERRKAQEEAYLKSKRKSFDEELDEDRKARAERKQERREGKSDDGSTARARALNRL